MEAPGFFIALLKWSFLLCMYAHPNFLLSTRFLHRPTDEVKHCYSQIIMHMIRNSIRVYTNPCVRDLLIRHLAGNLPDVYNNRGVIVSTLWQIASSFSTHVLW